MSAGLINLRKKSLLAQKDNAVFAQQRDAMP